MKIDFEGIERKLSIRLSDNRYENRINALQGKGSSTHHIEKCVADAITKLDSGATSFVIYGEPQSGKTEAMIALTCKLLDYGFETIFVLMNDNVQLQRQNMDRFRNAVELNSRPFSESDISESDDNQLKRNTPRVIFCRKNSKLLIALHDNCRHMKKRVVIDDEADFASPNSNCNKENKDPTTINRLVEQLIDVDNDGVYVGVTATPGRLDLNNTFFNNSKDWVFLDPYPDYKGREYFFPVTRDQVSKSDYTLKLLPSSGEATLELEKAVYRYLIKATYLYLKRPHGSDQGCYSMLVHTAGLTGDHKKDSKQITRVMERLKSLSYDIKGDQVICERLAREYEALGPEYFDLDFSEIFLFLITKIDNHEVLIVNSTKQGKDVDLVDRACTPKHLFTFVVGGNVVSRGLTFNNLLLFYFSRGVKSKYVHNTYIQRARMFGNRPYSKYFELSIPEDIFEVWANVFNEHESSVQSAMAGDYVHYQSKKTAAADPASINKKYVSVEASDFEHSVGGVFPFSESCKRMLLSNSRNPLTVIRNLIENGEIDFNPTYLTHLRRVVGDDESQIKLLLPGRGEDFYSIDKHSDGDSENISRKRGGLIGGIINGRKGFNNYTALICPVKNKSGQMRFYVKSQIGSTVLKNKKEGKLRSIRLAA